MGKSLAEVMAEAKAKAAQAAQAKEEVVTSPEEMVSDFAEMADDLDKVDEADRAEAELAAQDVKEELAQAEKQPSQQPVEKKKPKKEVKQELAQEEILPGGMTTNCMLVRMTITGWDASKLDKQLTDEIATAKGIKKKVTHGSKAAAQDLVRTYKTIVDPDRIKEVKAAGTELRTLLYTYTFPWLDNGERLITAKAFGTFNSAAHQKIDKYMALAKKLAADLDLLIQGARMDLGSAFNSRDYPTPDDVLSRFSATISYAPVPTSGDIRVDIQADALEKIKADLEAREKAATALTLQDTWRRIHKVAAAMAERLGDPDNKFHGTLIGNILDLVNLLPALNWTGDPELETARRTLEDQLCKHDPETLKEDKAIRKQTAHAAAKMAQAAQQKLDEFDKIASAIL